MVRIAIVTMSRDISYGGNLQAYALQTVVEKKMPGKCLHIAREPKKHKIFVAIRRPRNILTNINRGLHICKHKRKMKLFENFQKKYIKFTSKVYTAENANELNQKFDLFITGSDQVWNCARGIDEVLYLKFVEIGKMKTSYAASIGLSNIPKQYEEEFANEIKKYDFISVREFRAKEIVELLTCKQCVQVLDPVFLLLAEEWERIIDKPRLKEPYIYVYGTQVTDSLIQAVRECAEQTGYKVISAVKLLNYETVDFESGPLEFLNYIKNASYIITSSFHCVAFSLIFGKHLTAIPHTATGSRVTDVLKTLGAERALYKNSFLFEMPYDNKEVQSNIEMWRKKSIKYLDMILSEGEQRYGR